MLGASSVQGVMGMMNSGEQRGSGTEFSQGQWNQQMAQAETAYGQLTGTKGASEGLLAKPTNNEASLEGWRSGLAEKYYQITPEQQRAFEQATREYMKQVVGVNDTADLDLQAKKTYDAMWAWFTSKII